MQVGCFSERQFPDSLLSPQWDKHLIEGAINEKTVITICHPVWKLHRGGLERQMVQLIGNLPNDEFRHVVVVRGWDPQSEQLACELGENVDLIRQSESGRDGAWSSRLAAILSEYSVDILHVRGLSMLVDSVLAAEHYHDTAVSCSFHGFESESEPFKGIRRKVYRESMLRCRARWAVSDSAAAAITRKMNLPRETFEVIPNGVDVTHFAPLADRTDIRNTLGLPTNRPVLLSVGNFKPIKGHETLLKSIQGLGEDAKHITWVLIGKDYLGGSLQQWAADHLSGIDLRFCGEQTDVRPWYQAADIFILPSLWEGLSNALLEAMACGLPVIASRIGGTLDVVENGRSGLLVEAGDEKVLGCAIKRLLDNGDLRSRLGLAARKRVSHSFSAEQTADDYAEHYHTLVKEAEANPVETVTGVAV